ncbi:phenylacetate--CoA ligase family protein [Streptomyces sp. V1I1]|uniref:phenylacetate--CoA ligase family protein n=1 Tax=Streptomyces sp. V1I1 TaxID=3042272 RepID=UPI0027D8E9EB|nr:AMP-binding protein [Streptomyces sp. V1I1]
MSLDEFMERHPELSFDTARAADDKKDTPHLEACLLHFTEYVSGKEGGNFTWTADVRRQVSRHPVYRRPAYSVDEFGTLPTLSRSELRKLREPFDYEASGTTTAYGDQTSGTSGAPLTVVYSPRFMSQYLHLNMFKVAIRAGIRDLGGRQVFAVTITDNPSLGAGVIIPDPLDLVGLRLIWYVDPSDPQSIARLTTFLREFDPEVLSSKPNLLQMLLDHWETESPEPPCGPRFAVSGGAMLPDALRQQMADYFGCPVISAYAISEAGYLGSECERQKIHLDESLHERFEILPAEGAADTEPSAGDSGELAVTSLSNLCMPLVRYRVGDLATMSRNTCACGAPGPVLDELQGRTTLVFDLGGGHVLSPTRYMDLFKEHPELREYQLTQRDTRSFLLRIELADDVAPSSRPVIYTRIQNAISAGMPVAVEIAWEEHTFAPEGAKFARFRSEVSA